MTQTNSRRAVQADFRAEKARLARALSKLGFCSRREAWDLIKAGRVCVNGQVQRDAERAINLNRDAITVDGTVLSPEPKVYLMLNKPRGLVTTTVDEKGRETVFKCLPGVKMASASLKVQKNVSNNTPQACLPHIFPVGRLDRASEGLLLFTNDAAWAERITNPESHLDKTYHVQIGCLADEAVLRRMQAGIRAGSDFLNAKRVSIVRQGEKNSWIEVILDEGRNRHIRRLLAGLGVEVLRLIRIAIGPVRLGTLGKGQFRHLEASEIGGLK